MPSERSEIRTSHRPWRVVAVLLLLATAAIAQALPTHLRGHVNSHLTGQPLPLADITILAADGSYVGFAFPNTSGAYTWSGDCPDSGSTCIAVLTVNQFFAGPYETLRVPFANGAADAVLDFTPHALASIHARVTGLQWPRAHGEYPEDDPPPITTFAFDAQAQRWSRVDALEVSTDDNGNITALGLREGRYRVCVGGIDLGVQRQCFDHQSGSDTLAKQTYTDIDLAEGEHRTLAFDMVAGGSLSGTIQDTYTQQPLAMAGEDKAVRVVLFDADGALFDKGTAIIDDAGNWRVAGTPKGRFRIETGMLDSAYREHFVLLPDIACQQFVCPLDRGSAVVTDSSGDVGGIDLAVHPSVVIRGRVTDRDTQQPIAGVAVSATWFFRPDINEAPWIPVAHTTHSDRDGNYAVYAPAQPPVQLSATDTRYLPTCAGGSCPGWVTDDKTKPGDVFDANIALPLGGTFSGTLRDAAGNDAGSDLSIYDEQGNSVFSIGDEHALVSIRGAYRSVPLPAGTYYAVAQTAGSQGARTGNCQVYAARPCPFSTDGRAVMAVSPTPIVVSVGTDRSGVDFTLVQDGIFTDGFGPYFF